MKKLNAPSIRMLLLGIIILILAAGIALYRFGILKTPSWSELTSFWPYLAAAAAIAIILRRKVLSVLLIISLLVICGLYITERMSAGAQREIVNQVASGQGIDLMKLDLAYGAGKFSIRSGSSGYYIVNTIHTADKQDPEMNVERNGSMAIIEVKRQGSIAISQRDESWDMALSPEILIDMSLNYGAADAKIDLRNLKVDALAATSGATNTEITFGSFPTKATIDTGASSIDLLFPKDAGVKVTVEGGLIRNDFSGFAQQGDSYTSAHYDENGSSIEVHIKAGAATLKGEFY